MQFNGKILRQLRLAKGWNVQDLSRASGISRHSIYGYELRHNIPSANVLKQLADALEVATDDLYTDLEAIPKERTSPSG